MSAVATSSASSQQFFKRHRTSTDESEGELSKRPKYYYILEPETTDYSSSEGRESIYSIQGRTTDTAKDTSDTSTKSEDSMVEFEVVSPSDDPVYPFTLGRDSSSPPEDILGNGITIEIDEVFSDFDACDTSSVTFETERKLRRYLFKTCVLCGQTNDNSLYRYCDKCYKVRKNFFPPRPRGRKRKTEKSSSSPSISTKDDNDIITLSCDSGINSEFTQGSEQDIIHRKELCGTCLVRAKDGGYVHKNIVHVYSCYRCSVKTVKQIGRCPICNLRVRQVCRVITI